MCRILILDDNLAYAEQLAMAIENNMAGKSYQTVAVDKIEQAFSETRYAISINDPFDMYLIDQRLNADITGIEMMEKLLQMSPGSDALIFTAMNDPDDGIQAYKAGAFQYLIKPFTTEELLQVLEALKRWRNLKQERSWLMTINEILNQASIQSNFDQVAKAIVEGVLSLDFDRVLLFGAHPNDADTLIGLQQAGSSELNEFAGCWKRRST